MAFRKKNIKKKLAASLATLIIVLAGAYFEKGKTSSDSSISQLGTIQPLKYTRHARCRMGCRFLDESEVEDVIQNGRINKRKSNPKSKPCPVVAKEKKTKDGQLARVVYGQCRGQNKVITVIDLDTDHSCYCK